MYQILQNKDKELMLMIDAQACEPDGPMFIYDGGDTALLFRDWDSNICLKDIDPKTSTQLLKIDTILVCEMDGSSILRYYNARIRIVKDVKKLMM